MVYGERRREIEVRKREDKNALERMKGRIERGKKEEREGIRGRGEKENEEKRERTTEWLFYL